MSQRKLTCVPLLPQVGTLSNSILHVDAGLGEWAAMLDGYSEEVWLLAMKLGWGGGGFRALFACCFHARPVAAEHARVSLLSHPCVSS